MGEATRHLTAGTPHPGCPGLPASQHMGSQLDTAQAGKEIKNHLSDKCDPTFMTSNPCLGLGCRAATAPRHPFSLATVPVTSLFLLPALGGAPHLIAHRAWRGWQGEGSLGKVPEGGTPGQMPGAFSSSILGSCTRSWHANPTTCIFHKGK